MLLSLTRLGPVWSGQRLRLRDAVSLGLAFPDLVGWSDFYSGSACDVKVARATDGAREGWLVWGGTLGVRAVPAGWDVAEAVAHESVVEVPVLWVDELSAFPAEVVDVIAGQLMVDASGEQRDRCACGPGRR